MRTRDQIISEIARSGIIAVVRARSAEQVLPLSEALLAGGVRLIEITLTTPNAFAAIREAARRFAGAGLIGVGTVLKAQDCRAALEAGAEFVVSPIIRPELVAPAHEAGKPVMLGAYSATEAQTAFEAGSDFIKLFPADTLGPGYIKSLRAPLPHLKIVPTGGVTLQNIGEFFKAGCPAVGIGSSLISGAILEKNDWPELTRIASQYAAAAKASGKD